jgi:poly-beta-1,6-N-acetyl-D-glucosamine biosynthesis protein PgaD
MKRLKNIQVTLIDDRSLIYSKIKHHSKSELVISLITNTIGWGIWLYFWKVLFTSMAWYFGLNLAYQDWIIYGGWRKFLTFFEYTAPFGLALCCVLLIWAMQDIWRFKTERRRSGIRRPSIEKDVQWTKLSLKELKQARSEKVLKCHHNSEGEIVSVEPHQKLQQEEALRAVS